MTRPLNLVWRRKSWDERMAERYFLRHVLMGGLARPIITHVLEDDQPAPIMDDMLIFCHRIESDLYAAEAGRQARNVGIWHIGDEMKKLKTDAYPDLDYVIRHFWWPDVYAHDWGARCRDVFWVPHGFRDTVGPVNPVQNPPWRMRDIQGLFLGSIGHFGPIPDRVHLFETVERHQLPFRVVNTGGWLQGLGPMSYAAMMSRTRFAPCPDGNNPESIRLYDALECGAIPILRRTPWVDGDGALAVLGPVPFPVVGSWDELPALYAQLSQVDADRMEDWRRQIGAWWIAFKAHFAAKVAATIDAGFTRYWGVGA